MNFYDSLTYIWSFGQFFGINYLINHNDELKITNRSLITGIIFISLTIIGVVIVQPEEDDVKFITGSTSILYIVIQFGLFLQFGNTIFILVISLIQRKEILRFFKTIFELDIVLQESLQVNHNYERMRYKSSRNLFQIFGILILVCFIIDYVYAGNLTYVPIIIVNNFNDGLALMSSVDYFYCTKIIQKRLKALNKLVIQNQKLKPNELEIMITCHYKLNNLICLINKMFGLKQLLSITNDFAIVIVQLYSFFISVDNNFDDFVYMKFLSGALMTPILVTKIVITVQSCHKTIALKNNFGKLLLKIQNLKIDEPVSILVTMGQLMVVYGVIFLVVLQVDHFVLYDLHSDVKFTAFDLFPIDWTIIYAVNRSLDDSNNRINSVSFFLDGFWICNIFSYFIAI